MKSTHRSVRRAALLALLCAAVWGQPAGAAAEEPPRMCPICSRANNPQAPYGEKAATTLTRGALNLGLGWTEVIRQPAKEAEGGGNVFLGILGGIGRAVGRTASGFGEVVTFWTPKVGDRYIHFADDCPLDTER